MTSKAQFPHLLLYIFCVSIFEVTGVAVSQESDAELAAFREEFDTRAADAELSHNKYEKTLSKLLKRKSRWNLWNQLARLLKPLGRLNGGRILDFIFMVLGVFALIGAVLFFVRQVRRHLIVDAQTESPQSAEDSPVTARAALEQAEQFEVGQNFRGAIRALYLAALLHLQERGLLTYDRSLTNREYLHRLNAHPNLQDALRSVIHTFDEVWYGFRPCDADTVSGYRGLLQKVYEVSR